MEELGAELPVALDVLGLEARASLVRRVVGAMVFHKAYLHVERGEGRRGVREGGREPEPAAHPTDEPCA